MAKRGRPKKKYYSIEGKPADRVEQLRKAYGIDMRKTGMAVVGNTPLPPAKELPYIENSTKKQLTATIKNPPKKAGAAGKGFVKSQLEDYGSITGNAYNKWLIDMKNTYPNVDRENYDPTGFINDNLNMIKSEVGRSGTKVRSKAKKSRTETGYLVQGGTGLRGRLNRINVSYPSLSKELEKEEYKFGGLSPEDYEYLATYAGKGRLSRNDFIGILEGLNVVDGNKPSKFTQDPRLGQLFMQFMSYRLGRVQIKERTKIGDIQLELESQGIAKELEPYYMQLKKDQDIITTFNERNLKLYLQSPYASDEGLNDYAVLLNGKVKPEVKDILEVIYNESKAHLSEGGLPEEMANWSTEEVMNWVRDAYGPLKITEKMLEDLKDKLPPQTYRLMKEQFEKGELDPETIEYLERLSKGWVGVQLPPEEGPLWEKVKKGYRKRTPRYKVRFEAWFKAARLEFSGGGKSYPVLMELATRIAEQDYSLLFETDTEIKVWYQNWGNSDDRIRELIERLEANSGMEADWSLLDKKDNNAEKEVYQNEEIQKWVAELREFYEGKGYTKEEIDLIIEQEIEKL